MLLFEKATLIHVLSKSSGLKILTNATVAVDEETGKILKVFTEEEYSRVETFCSDMNISSEERITLSPSQALIPGFVDTHAHAPQYSFVGNGTDLPLMQWLDKYTFPAESRFSDLQYAEDIYKKSLKRHLSYGTTTICYYGTLHCEASKLLSDLVEDTGIRAYVGKVCMDCNSPDYYVEESAEKSLSDTIEFTNYVLAKKNPLVQPIITPRFAVTCSRDLMQGLGDIAREKNVLIQTHLSENKDEISFVKELFPECATYTEVYHKYNLLQKNTVLAHSIYLSDEELELIKQCKCGISHCPISNTSLRSGIMPTRKYMGLDLTLGLGSDIAGGYSTSILSVMRECIGTSKLLKCQTDSTEDAITLSEAFYLATLGGATVLGLESKVGNFEEGKEFDALLVDFKCENCPFDYLEDQDTIQDIFEKFIYLGDDRNILNIYVKGKLIK